MTTDYTITDIHGPLEIGVVDDKIRMRSATGEIASADINGVVFQTTSTVWTTVD